MSKNANVWNVPEGYEIDKEKSDERKIVLKKIEGKKASSWKEYCEIMKGKRSYFLQPLNKKIESDRFGDEPALAEFEDKEDVASLVAFIKLLKLRRNWICNWEPDWTNRNQAKYTIFVIRNEIVYDNICKETNHPMSFPTEEMRNEFLDTFKSLLNIAKPLL